MDRGDHLGHVAHVGARATHAPEPRVAIAEDAAETLGVADIEVEHGVVGAEFGVRRGRLLDVELTAGGDRASLEAAQHLRARALHQRGRVAAHIPAALAALRDRVGRLTAARDQAVHTRAAGQLLTQQPDRDLRDGERVGSVDPVLGIGRRMGGLAVVGDVEVADGVRPRTRDVDGAGMRHEGEVDAFERAAFEQDHLAPATLLGRRAQKRDREAELVGDIAEGSSRAHRRRRDDVVAARVPETGQRVVLRAQHDVQRSAAADGTHRRIETVVARRDLKPEVVHGGRDPLRGVVLLPGDLGVRVDVVTQRQQCVRVPLHATDHRLAWRAHLSSPGTPYDGALVGSSARVT